jgi:hypothetical protein
VTHRHFVKKRILEMLQQEILVKVAKVMPARRLRGQELKPL